MIISDRISAHLALPSFQFGYAHDGYVVATRRLAAIPLVLVEAEPVPGVVAKQGLDAVGPLGRLLQEGNALGLQLLVGGADVVGLDDAGAHRALGDQPEEGLGDLGNGDEIPLAPGNTWIELLPVGISVTYV